MKVNDPSEMGSRLREERKRLGMNQTEFAKAIGIHLNTQSRYEKGERDPDTAYLSAVARAGVDVGYMLTGEKKEDEKFLRRGLKHVIDYIQEFLDLAKGDIGREFDDAVRESREGVKLRWSDPRKADLADGKLEAVLKKSPRLLPGPWQFDELIARVDLVSEKLGLQIDPERKARAVVALLKEEKLTGKQADFAAVEAAIRQN